MLTPVAFIKGFLNFNYWGFGIPIRIKDFPNSDYTQVNFSIWEYWRLLVCYLFAGIIFFYQYEDKTDLILQTKIKRSQGGFILNEGAGYGPDPRAFGHNGTGGSSAFAALSPQVAFAYVPNQMLPEGLRPRAPRLADLFYDCL